MPHHLNKSIQEIHQLLKNGEIKSVELVTALFDRLEEVNSKLNAVIFVDKEQTLNAAQKADLEIANGTIRSTLHGIPVTIKDNVEVAGWPTTAGYEPFQGSIAENDAEIVRLLKAAGAIIIGKTNLPALTYDLQTNNKLFGRTNNPWNTNRTPGGSSGGCAAAVAAKISLLSFCNDSGGSIRIPAHFCGIYGFKASFGGISTKGIITQKKRQAKPLNMRTLFSAGILAQSIRDLQTAISLVGTDKLIRRSRKNEPQVATKLLWIDELEGFEVDREIKQAMHQLRERLVQNGVQIEAFSSDQFDFSETIRLWGHLSNYETGSELPNLMRHAGHLIMKRKYAKIPMYTELLKPISAKKYLALRKDHERLKRQFEALLKPYDGLILPASSVVAFPHQTPNRTIGHVGIYTTPLKVNEQPIHYAIATQSYALPFNVLESPVVVLPIDLTKENLPIGVQLVGKKNHDFDLLTTALTLEEYIPNIGTPPI